MTPFKHRKRRTPKLGQHLLTNSGIAHAVVRAAGVLKGDNVLEIGPGKGMLTRALLDSGARVIAVEKDPEMAAVLNETFGMEITEKRLEIGVGDAREITPDKIFPKGKYKVAANIPYYITGELIRMCLTAKNQPATIAFLVQKEVAERITGYGKRRAGKPMKESILSLSVKAYGTPKYVKTVSRGSFNPPPSVDSAILAIEDISRKNFTPAVLENYQLVKFKNKNLKYVQGHVLGHILGHVFRFEEMFFRVVKAGFAQKRKTLGGNLKRVFGERALRALAEIGVPEKTRAEDVPLEKWLALTRNFIYWFRVRA